MKRVFVFFTNKESLTREIGINEEMLAVFDCSNHGNILLVGSLKQQQVVFTNQNLPNDIIAPYFVLIKDSIDFPNQPNNAIGNSYKLQSILNNIDEIYLVIHKTNPSSYLATFQRLFSNKLKSYIYESHVSNSIYNRILKRVLNDKSITDLSALENDFLKEFPNPIFESLIRIRKSLQVFAIKSCSKDEFNKWKGGIKSDGKIPQVVKDKVESITYENYINELESIENSIVELHTKR